MPVVVCGPLEEEAYCLFLRWGQGGTVVGMSGFSNRQLETVRVRLCFNCYS